MSADQVQSLTRYLLIVKQLKSSESPIRVAFDGTLGDGLTSFLQTTWPQYFTDEKVAQDKLMHLAWDHVVAPSIDTDLDLYWVRPNSESSPFQESDTWQVDSDERYVPEEYPYLLFAYMSDGGLKCTAFQSKIEAKAELVKGLRKISVDNIAYLIYGLKERKTFRCEMR